jgi:translation initiation factor 2 alpha subunit (eIF-2alpha)
VEYEEGEEYALSRGFLFSEVSSLKRKNIELLLRKLRSKVSKLLANDKQQRVTEDRIKSYVVEQERTAHS